MTLTTLLGGPSRARRLAHLRDDRGHLALIRPTSWHEPDYHDASFTTFTIDDTPRHGIAGSTEVRLAGPHEVTSLTWRPSPREIISDVVRDYFLRCCERELGEPIRELTAEGEAWRWNVGGYEREVVASTGDDRYSCTIRFTERPLPAAALFGLEVAD